MAYDFPANPVEDQEFVPPVGGQVYIFKSPRWLVKGIPPLGGDVSTGIDEAPNDGKQYGRQNTAWAEVVPNPDWATLAGKPVTFPPTLPIPWSDISGKPTTYPPVVPIAWADVSGKPATYPPTLPIGWGDVSGKPTTFPPTLPIQMTDVTGLMESQQLQDESIGGKLDASTFTAANVLTMVKSVDGVDSGLDADLLDGQNGTYYSAWGNLTGKPTTFPPTLPIAWADVSDKPISFPPTLPIAQSDVTDLTADLASKEPVISGGNTNQYWRGDKTWVDLPPPGVEEAPTDGTMYARKDASWVYAQTVLPSGVVISDAPPLNPIIGQLWWESDTGNLYIWYDDGNSVQWTHVSGFAAYSFGAGGGIAEAPSDGTLYARSNTQWIQIGSSGGVPEAPLDGKQYVRKNGQWVEPTFPPEPTYPMTFDVNGDAIVKFGANVMVRIKTTGLILTKDDIEVFSTGV